MQINYSTNVSAQWEEKEWGTNLNDLSSLSRMTGDKDETLGRIHVVAISQTYCDTTQQYERREQYNR